MRRIAYCRRKGSEGVSPWSSEHADGPRYDGSLNLGNGQPMHLEAKHSSLLKQIGAKSQHKDTGTAPLLPSASSGAAHQPHYPQKADGQESTSPAARAQEEKIRSWLQTTGNASAREGVSSFGDGLENQVEFPAAKVNVQPPRTRLRASMSPSTTLHQTGSSNRASQGGDGGVSRSPVHTQGLQNAVKKVVLKRSDDGTVGLRLTRPNILGPLLVHEVVPFSPAEVSRNIKPGDLLHTVDTSNVDKLAVNDVARMLQGTPGSAVVLTV